MSQYYEGGDTYNAEMADNRIISLLHPPSHSKKSLSQRSNFFLVDTVQEHIGELLLCGEYLRTPSLVRNWGKS